MVRARRAFTIALGSVGLVAMMACKPEFAERASEVTSLRVLAVGSTPAEGDPLHTGDSISYTALVVDPSGPRDDAALEWNFCTEPKPVNELNDIAGACFALDPDASQFTPLMATGVKATGTLPVNGCRQFGPNPPEAKDGGLPGRPADPDPTGGYYQPVRVRALEADNVVAMGQTRLRCDLAGATSEILREFTGRYVPNANPTIERLVAVRSSDEEVPPSAGGSVSLTVGRGEAVRLRVAWPTCGENVPCPADSMTCPEPEPCGGAESYAVFDLQTRAIVAHREAMRASWFTTAGSFTDDTTGQGEEQAAVSQAENTWTAPDAPNDNVWLWLVLRDNRGGVTWNAYHVVVQ
jgi:hypothetical protein